MSAVSTDSSIIETIKKRMSVRSYEAAPVTEEDFRSIEEYMRDTAALTGPFGGVTRLELVKVTKDVSDKGIKLGTYGVIRNPKGYLIGIIGEGNSEESKKKGLLDFGYTFEKLVLFLTAKGIGTCWMGGTFNRNSFEKEINLGDDEKIPCITPMGYPKEKQGLLNSAMRYMVKADQKKGWEELFSDGDFGRPLQEGAAGPLAVPIEMVRLGPSASNKQPWRLVASKDRKTVHFYLAHTPRYSDTMQRIDMGIAMSHFELACEAQGLKGKWVEKAPALAVPNDQTEYIISWESAE
jgi:hypothetical protein